MNVFVFLGPPGVGKGTQASLLSLRLGAEHVSTGAILREEISAGTALGNQVKPILAKGELVSDELLFQCLTAKLRRSLSKKSEFLILDGVPRTLSQVSRLDKVLADNDLKVNKVLALVAPIDALVDRFAKRWTCSKCGQVVACDSVENAKTVACQNCGQIGGFFRRPDDEPETVRKRKLVYEKDTAPLLDHFKSFGIVREFDGLRSAERVYVELAFEILKC